MSPRLTVPRPAVRQFLCTNLGTTNPTQLCSSRQKQLCSDQDTGQPSCACLPAPGSSALRLPPPPSASSASSAHLAAIQTLLAQLIALAFLVAPPYRLPEPFRGLLAVRWRRFAVSARCLAPADLRTVRSAGWLHGSRIRSTTAPSRLVDPPCHPGTTMRFTLFSSRSRSMCKRVSIQALAQLPVLCSGSWMPARKACALVPPHTGINSTDGSFPTAKDAQRKDDAKEIRSVSAHSTSGAIHPDMPDRLTA